MNAWLDIVSYDLITPLGMRIAHDLVEVDLIDMDVYQKLQDRLKQDCLFVVSGTEGMEREGNRSTWKGLRLICKEFEIVSVWFQYDHITASSSLACLQTWNRNTKQYSTLAASLTPTVVLHVLGAFLRAEEIIAQSDKEVVLN